MFLRVSMENSSQQHLDRALGFAREQLGPASERLVSSAASQALILSRVRAGVAVEDAVLAEVHRAARVDQRAADEFLAYFLDDAHRRGSRLLSDGLRRFLETGDLVQSVFGEVWSSIADLQFETRAQFVALLAQRLRWKATDKARRMQSERRNEHNRHPLPVDELSIPADDRPPSSNLGRQEETEEMIARLLRLPERDQQLVRLHLRGADMQAIADATGLSPDTARKALSRAIERIQNRTNAAPRRGGDPEAGK